MYQTITRKTCYNDEFESWNNFAQKKQERESRFPINLCDKGIKFECLQAKASRPEDKGRTLEDIRDHASEDELDAKVRGMVATAACGLVVADPQQRLTEHLDVVKKGAVAKMNIGSNVLEESMVEQFLASAVDTELKELVVASKAVSAFVPGFLPRFSVLSVLK